jgi:hypothetical protein
MGELLDEQPITWFVLLPDVPLPNWEPPLGLDLENSSGTGRRAGPPEEFPVRSRIIALSERRGPRLLVCRIVKGVYGDYPKGQYGNYTGGLEIRTLELRWLGDQAWPEMAKLLEWQAEA